MQQVTDGNTETDTLLMQQFTQVTGWSNSSQNAGHTELLHWDAELSSLLTPTP